MQKKLKKLFGNFGYFSVSDTCNFQSLGSKFDKSIFLVTSTFSSILMSVSCAFLTVNSYWWWGVSIGGLALIISSIGNHYDMERSKKQHAHLRNELDKREVELKKATKSIETLGIKHEEMKVKLNDIHMQLVNSLLISIYKTVGLDSSCRISIYFEQEGSFSILGRYSSNPKFSKVRTLKFAINKGALSKAWELGVYFSYDCPQFSSSKRKYQNYQKDNFGYGIREINKFTMKSCEYAGLAVKNNSQSIGVILFESEKRNSLENLESEINNQVKYLQTELANAIISGEELYSEKYGTEEDVDKEFINSIKDN